MITRRGMLGILAAGFAPAAIGSGVLMPVRKIARSWPVGVSEEFERIRAGFDALPRPVSPDSETFIFNGTHYIVRNGELYRRIPGYERYDGKPFLNVGKWNLLASAETVHIGGLPSC